MILPLSAQIHEFGFGGGSATLISDLGTDSFYLPDGYFVTALYRGNTNEWISFRINLSYARVTEADSLSESEGRRLRNWNANTDIVDLNVMIEYNFLPTNPYRIPHGVWVTPYIAGGLGVYGSFLHITAPNKDPIDHNENSAFIPLAFGVKFIFRNRMKLVFEIRPQYSLKDNLEGSLIMDSKELPHTNQLSNDWFIYNGITLTFGWGKLPCYLNIF